MSRAKRILGLEGGGTKTEWVIVEPGPDGLHVVERGQLPASNMRLLADSELLQIFETLPRDATHVGACLAGCATPEDNARLRKLCAWIWPEALIFTGSDRDSALAVSFQDGDGIIIISGTGAAVHGRRDGRIEKAGGWGHIVGDRGGGYDLAHEGLRLVLTHYDKDQRITPLAERILRDTGTNTLPDLAGWAMRAGKMDIARLAPAIFEAARRGEPEMLITIQNGADLLADFAVAVAARLGFGTARPPRVRLIGGIFKHHQDYVELVKYRLSTELPGCDVAICEESGALGAAWLANRAVDPGRDEWREPRPSTPGQPVQEHLDELATAATEQPNPASARIGSASPAEIVALFVEEEDRVRQALAAAAGPLAAGIEVIAASLKKGGRLFYVGAGTSGRLGVLDASEIPPTFGADPALVQGIMAGGTRALTHAVEGAEDARDGGAMAVLHRGVRAGDVVCGITASGRTPFVIGALERARLSGARTLLLTCNPARRASAVPWDVEIDLPTGAEIVTGSTRLKAGTATKVALNILSTGAMVRLGKVSGNAMVDLKISNEKLRDRGARLVATALGVSYDEARQRLASAGWNVRAVMDGKGGK